MSITSQLKYKSLKLHSFSIIFKVCRHSQKILYMQECSMTIPSTFTNHFGTVM